MLPSFLPYTTQSQVTDTATVATIVTIMALIISMSFIMTTMTSISLQESNVDELAMELLLLLVILPAVQVQSPIVTFSQDLRDKSKC